MPQAVRTALYRHWDASERLLYVGIACDPVRRVNAHRERSAWFDRIGRIDIEWFPSRREALQAERKAIQSEQPWFNVHHARSAGGDSAERGLKWAVLHLESGRIDGWYRAEADAQDVLDFLREQFAAQHFVMLKERSKDHNTNWAQFRLYVDGRNKWMLDIGNSQISAG